MAKAQCTRKQSESSRAVSPTDSGVSEAEREFCGVLHSQNLQAFEINFQQSEYAKHLRPVAVSRERRAQRDAPAAEKEIKALRAINGAANWLSGQSRTDLAVQTSFSQPSQIPRCQISLLQTNWSTGPVSTPRRL